MGEQMEKTELYDHHRHRKLKKIPLYFCKECVRSYDSKTATCKFCGKKMKLLDEGAKMHYYYCAACGKHTESLATVKKCSCGAGIKEIKKWENLKPADKIEITAGKVLKKIKRK